MNTSPTIAVRDEIKEVNGEEENKAEMQEEEKRGEDEVEPAELLDNIDKMVI